jgi:DNA-binding GntR family transcriptional regulator
MNDITVTIPPTIAQMRENSLSGVVRHEIERLILSGELPTGTRVNENAVALRLGVSRGPVREACRALVELGLLDLIPNRGVFVRRMDRHDVEEVYDLRAGLTGLAGSLLAARITDAEIDRLRTLVDEMDKAAEAGDFRTFYPINLEFHDVILQLTGNGRLIKSYRALVKEFQLFRTHGLVERGVADAERVGVLLVVGGLERMRGVAQLRPGEARDREPDRQRLERRPHVVDVLDLAALERRDAAAAYEASFGHVQHGKQRMFAAFDKLTKSGAAAQHGEMHQRTIE